MLTINPINNRVLKLKFKIRGVHIGVHSSSNCSKYSKHYNTQCYNNYRRFDNYLMISNTKEIGQKCPVKPEVAGSIPVGPAIPFIQSLFLIMDSNKFLFV